jgi:hypothetical protein
MTNISPDEFAKQLITQYYNQFMNDEQINSFIAEGIRSSNFLKERGYSQEWIENLSNEIENLK